MYNFGETLMASVLHQGGAVGGAPLRVRVPSVVRTLLCTMPRPFPDDRSRLQASRTSSPPRDTSSDSELSFRDYTPGVPKHSTLSLSHVPMPGAYTRSMTDVADDTRSLAAMTVASTDSESTLTDCERMVVRLAPRPLPRRSPLTACFSLSTDFLSQVGSSLGPVEARISQQL